MEDLLKQKIEEGFFKRLGLERNRQLKTFRDPETHMAAVDKNLTTGRTPEEVKKVRGTVGRSFASRTGRLQARNELLAKKSPLQRATSKTLTSGGKALRKLFGMKRKNRTLKGFETDSEGQVAGSHTQMKDNPLPKITAKAWRPRKNPKITIESILFGSLNSLLNEYTFYPEVFGQKVRRRIERRYVDPAANSWQKAMGHSDDSVLKALKQKYDNARTTASQEQNAAISSRQDRLNYRRELRRQTDPRSRSARKLAQKIPLVGRLVRKKSPGLAMGDSIELLGKKIIESFNSMLMEARGDTLAARYEKKTGRPFPEDLNVPERGKKAGPRIKAAVRIARGK